MEAEAVSNTIPNTSIVFLENKIKELESEKNDIEIQLAKAKMMDTGEFVDQSVAANTMAAYRQRLSTISGAIEYYKQELAVARQKQSEEQSLYLSGDLKGSESVSESQFQEFLNICC